MDLLINLVSSRQASISNYLQIVNLVEIYKISKESQAKLKNKQKKYIKFLLIKNKILISIMN